MFYSQTAFSVLFKNGAWGHCTYRKLFPSDAVRMLDLMLDTAFVIAENELDVLETAKNEIISS
jgi:hypothetical protein